MYFMAGTYNPRTRSTGKTGRPAQGNNSRKRIVKRTFKRFGLDGKTLPPRKA